MIFEIIPIAEASVTTLMKSVSKVIINPIILLLFALAVVYFLFGFVNYLLNPDNETIRKESKDKMLWGIIGLFVMVSVFGIMSIILNSLGEKRIDINNSGDYTIGEMTTTQTN